MFRYGARKKAAYGASRGLSSGHFTHPSNTARRVARHAHNTGPNANGKIHVRNFALHGNDPGGRKGFTATRPFNT
jgi:hypothetical protein